jgi:hypothetical protein
MTGPTDSPVVLLFHQSTASGDIAWSIWGQPSKTGCETLGISKKIWWLGKSYANRRRASMVRSYLLQISLYNLLPKFCVAKFCVAKWWNMFKLIIYSYYVMIVSNLVLCYAMPSNTMLSHELPPCHAMLCHATLCYVMACHAKPYYTVLWHVMLDTFVPCKYTVSCQDILKWCHAMYPFHAIPCYIMLDHVIPCYTIYAMLFNAMPCHKMRFTQLTSWQWCCWCHLVTNWSTWWWVGWPFFGTLLWHHHTSDVLMRGSSSWQCREGWTTHLHSCYHTL